MIIKGKRYNHQIYYNISCSIGLLFFIVLIYNSSLLLPTQLSSLQIANAEVNHICGSSSNCNIGTNVMNINYWTLNKISDSDLEPEVEQEIYQSNECMDDALCRNSAIMSQNRDKNVLDDKLDSNRLIIQSNECSDNQICVNDAEILDHAFLSKESRNIIQHCDTSSGPTCLNDNSVRIDTDALRKAMLEYVEDEDQEKNK